MTNFDQTLEWLDEVHTHVWDDLKKATGRFGLIQFGRVSEKDFGIDPPGLGSGGWRDSRLDYEALLGEYLPRSRSIRIYTKGIAYAAALLGSNPERLKRVVQLHERAHVLHHLGYFDITLVQNDLTEKYANKRFRKAPEEFKEQLAQLSVLLAIRTRIDKVQHPKAKEYLQNLKEIFFALMARQSPKYKLSDEIRGLSLSQLQYKLKLLFQMSDDGYYPNQDYIVRICCASSDTR